MAHAIRPAVVLALVVSFVRLTPAVAASVTLSATQTTWIAEDSPGANFSADGTLVVSSRSGSARHALVQFDVSGLPACAVVSAATLQLHVDASDQNLDGSTVHAV